MAWKADSIQGVLFTVPGAPQLDAQQLWDLATSSLPETVQRPAGGPNGLSIASGRFEEYGLAIQSQLGRIDWNLNPVASLGSTDVPRIDDYAAAGKVLSDLVQKALQSVRPVRVALVAEFSHIFPSDEEVAAFLTEQTNGVWFPIPTQDSVYQVNARSKYAGDRDFMMNRIVTWSGSFYHQFSAQFAFGIPQAPGFLTPEPVYAASMKIDVNSATGEDISAFAETMVQANLSELLSIASSGIKHLK